MPAVVSCSHCHKPLGVPEEALGKTVRCPLCGNAFVAATPPPTASAVTAAPAPAPVPSRPEPINPPPRAAPVAPSLAAPLPVRARRRARSEGRRPFPWLIATSVGLGVTAVAGVVLVFVLNRPEDRLPDNIWREVRNEHGGFRVLMPGVPQPGPGAGNRGFMTTGVEMDSSHNGFFVGYGDIPDAEFQRIPLQQRFDGARDGMLAVQKGGKLLRETAITIDGHPGREVEGETLERVPHEKPHFVGAVARMCAVKLPGRTRLYVVVAVGPGYRADVPDIRKFLDSFHPMPPPAAPAEDKQVPEVPKQAPKLPEPPNAPPQPKEPIPPAKPNPPDYPHTSTVVGLAFGEQGKWLFTATEGREILCWDSAKRLVRRRVTAPAQNGQMGAFAVSPKGPHVALALHGGLLRLTDMTTGAETVLNPQGAGGISRHCVAFSPDGKLLAVGQGDRVVTVWDVNERRVRHTLTGHNDQVLSVAFSPDGRTLASGCADRIIRLWDPATGKLKRSLAGHRPPRVPFDGFRSWQWAIPALAFSPDGKWLASASNDQTVILWDLTGTGKQLTLPHRDCVLAVAFAPNGTRLATGTADGEVTLWQTSNGQARERTQMAGKAPVRALAFHPEGMSLAIAAGVGVELRVVVGP
jgi:hypothetical protein